MLIPDVCRAWTRTRVTSRSSRSGWVRDVAAPSPPSFLALFTTVGGERIHTKVES